MKNIFQKTFALVAILLSITSCSNDDNETITGNGSLKLEFDNAFGSNDLLLKTQGNTTSAAEELKIDELLYIVSNIILTKEDGTTVSYPKNESYFIINEADPTSLVVELKNIPAANYTKVTFGIGVDKAQWELGANGQGDFLAKAQDAGMLWNWTAGYKFLAFEGTFTSTSVTTAAPFMVHTGKTGTDYNYTDVALVMPNKAMVRTNLTPEVHIVADASKIIDGANKIKLTDNNESGMGAMIMGGANLALITSNLSQMFSVDHVHND